MRQTPKRRLPLKLVLHENPLWVSIAISAGVSVAAIWGAGMLWSTGPAGHGHSMLPLAAVLCTALIGGFGPGFLSVLITTGWTWWYLPPTESIRPPGHEDLVWVLTYFVVAMGANWLGAFLKSTLRTAERSSTALEKEVENRTAQLRTANEELRKMLGEIEQSREFLDSVVDNIPNMIFVKDAKNLRFVRLNKAAEDLLGIPSHELIGKSDFDVFPEKEARFFVEKDREVLSKKKVLDIMEELIDTQAKGRRVLHTKKFPVCDSNGDPIFLVGISEDITESKRFEEERLSLIYEQAARIESERRRSQLEHALQARDTFLSICSHELKTPLTTLKLQAGMLRNLIDQGNAEAILSPKGRRLVTETDKEIVRLTRLIEDMLDVSRIRGGKLSLHPEEVDLNELVCEVVERFRLEPVYSNIPIEIDVPGGLRGFWDRSRIEQVLSNLISNALKYGRNQAIRIAAHRDLGRIVIVVEDHGIGIAPEDQYRIFQRFERAVGGTISGLGLGLFIVKEIVSRHGGAIRVESQKGVGSRFIVELPERLSPAARAA